MQEELENRTVTLMVSSSKFTGRTLKSAISHFLNYTRHKAQDQSFSVWLLIRPFYILFILLNTYHCFINAHFSIFLNIIGVKLC